MEDLLIKVATVIAVAIATFSSFPGTAQRDKGTMTQTAPMTQSSPQNSEDATSNPAAAVLKPVSGELVRKLDARSAKQGDSVILKTDQSSIIPEGTEIPKGSRLVGHVTHVQARRDGKENSQIAILFDRAELKSGQTLPIESVIQSVAPSRPYETTGTSFPESSGAIAASPAAPAINTPASANQNTMNNNRPGLASNMTVQTGAIDQNTHGDEPAPGSIVARSGNVAIRSTAIPGVLLANDVKGLPFTNASGMLLGARRDVRLEGGTHFVLAIAMAPQGPSGASR
jgi:hypothetical protein